MRLEMGGAGFNFRSYRRGRSGGTQQTEGVRNKINCSMAESSEQVSEAPHDSESIKAREREQIVSIIKQVFKSNGSKLRDAVKGSLSDFINKLLEKNFITQAAKEKENYEVIIREVDSIWDLLPNVESLQVKFKEFHFVLMDLGGPPEMAGKALHDLVQQEVDQVLPDVHFLHSTKCGRSASTPGNVVGIKPKINRNAYSMQDTPRSFRTEDSFIEETNNSYDSSNTTKTETDDNPIFFEPKEARETGDKNSQFTSPSLLRPTKPLTSTPSNHQNMVLPNGKLPNSIALRTSTPSLDSRQHSIDSGVPMSKINSPQDDEVKPLLNEPLNPQLVTAGGMSDSFLGSGMMPVQPVSDQQHSEPTERVLDITGTYHPSSSQQLSSASERNMSDTCMYTHFREDMNYERKKREEADEKLLKKLEDDASYFKTEVEKLKRDNESLNNELIAERGKNESLQTKLNFQKTFFDKEMIDLNKEKMTFDQEKREFHSNQEQVKTEMERKWRELNESRDQLNREKTAIEKVQAEQDARESELKKEHQNINGLRAQITQEKLSQERYFKQEESELLRRKGLFQQEILEEEESFEQELFQRNKSFQQEMLQRKHSFRQEMKQKRKKHDEEWEKITHVTKSEKEKLKKQWISLHRYEKFLFLIGFMLFVCTLFLYLFV